MWPGANLGPVQGERSEEGGAGRHAHRSCAMVARCHVMPDLTRLMRQMRMFAYPFRGSRVGEDHGAKAPFRHESVLNLSRYVGRGPVRIGQAHEAEQAGVCGKV